MHSARRWLSWPKRTSDQLNGVAGVAGLGGVVFCIGTWVAISGPVGVVLASTGLVITLGTLGYAMYRAVPPKQTRATAMVGQVVELRDLSLVSDRLPRLSIVGPTMAGKTTLKDRLTLSPSDSMRTQKMTARVVATQTAPPSFIAVLDGGGEKYSQQFELAKHCDCLCLIVDHSASDVESRVDPERLSHHAEFLRQIRHYLDESGCPPKHWIRLLINKRDLWERAVDEERSQLVSFYESELAHWKQWSRSRDVEVLLHSNDHPADIAAFYNIIKATAASLGRTDA